MEKTIELKDKWLLSIDEAATYFGIGSKKVRAMSVEGIEQGWALMNGSKTQIKRVKFEQWLDEATVI